MRARRPHDSRRDAGATVLVRVRHLLARKIFFIADPDVHLGRRNPAARDARNLQARADVERCHGLLEHASGQAGVQQRSQEHVAADAREAVEIGDAHGKHSAWPAGRQTFIIGKRVPRGQTGALRRVCYNRFFLSDLRRLPESVSAVSEASRRARAGFPAREVPARAAHDRGRAAAQHPVRRIRAAAVVRAGEEAAQSAAQDRGRDRRRAGRVSRVSRSWKSRARDTSTPA